jgi:hypothetical protein
LFECNSLMLVALSLCLWSCEIQKKVASFIVVPLDIGTVPALLCSQPRNESVFNPLTSLRLSSNWLSGSLDLSYCGNLVHVNAVVRTPRSVTSWARPKTCMCTLRLCASGQGGCKMQALCLVTGADPTGALLGQNLLGPYWGRPYWGPTGADPTGALLGQTLLPEAAGMYASHA